MNTDSAKRLSCALVLALLLTAACDQKPEQSTGQTGTPETTQAPATDVNGLFPVGDKDYFVPFSDPDHSYCTITEGFGTPLREQGAGGCYSYASVSAMQSNYMKEHGELIDLNPVDLIYRIYETPKTDDDGNPIYDEEKYYVTGANLTDLGGGADQITGVLCADSLNGYLISEHNIIGSYNCEVNAVHTASEEEVKDAIRSYGAIGLTVNYTKGCKMINGYFTQNYQDNATDTNHVSVIIGWDDDFPAECFQTPATRNGAWLVQNSFGEYWGNMGYYWVSFDMPIPALFTLSVTGEYSSGISYGKFSELYLPSSDLFALGTQNADISEADFGKINTCNSVTSATVYDKSGTIGAIGIWTVLPGQSYEIEVLEGEFGKVKTTLAGSFEHAGYHTVKLEKPLKVKKFTVVVKTPSIGCFEGGPFDFKVSSITTKYPARYVSETRPGRSFVQIGEEWVDVTDPSLISKLGYDSNPEFADCTTIGDPCITVLYV